MASKVMVKMPVQAFAGTSQVAKSKSSEVLPVGRNTDIRSPDSGGSHSNAKGNGNAGSTHAQLPLSPTRAVNSESRIAYLEQNIRYLQEQHQFMLTGLHHEIDCLRHRNREMQFQLVFHRGTNVSTPSSPEDDKQKLYSNSPKVLNITPLQVEILEKELGEMKIQLQESECRNVYLSAIVDEQKKKLERYERDRERERERGIQPDPELLRKLDDAESLIRRLRRENSDLRRENAVAVANAPVPYQQPQQQRDYHHQRNSGQRRRGGNGGSAGGTQNGVNNGGNLIGNNTSSVNPSVQNHSSGSTQNVPAGNGANAGAQPYRPNWFPPLHTQNYWQQQNRPQGSHVDSLPQLQSSRHHVVYQQGSTHQGHGRRGGGNNNHYQHHATGERKYRGNNQQNRGQKSS